MHLQFLFFSLFYFFSGPESRPDKISEKIVLQIDQVKISEYEFEKNLNQFKQTYTQRYNREAPPDSIKSWIEDFKSETILLAEAYKKGYHNSEKIKKQLKVSDKAILTQMHGPWYQKEILDKILLSEQDLKKAYERKKQSVSFSFIKFKDPKEAAKFIKDNKVTSREYFQKAISTAKAHYNVEFHKGDLSGPSSGYWNIQDQLWQMKAGEVAHIKTYDDLFSEAVYLLCVEEIKEISPKPFETEKESITQVLRLIREFYLIHEKVKEVFDASQPEILSTQQAHGIIQCFNNFESPDQVSENGFVPYLQTNVLTYKKGAETLTMNLKQFLEHYKYLPLKTHIVSYEQFKQQLFTVVISDYLYEEVVSIGLDKEKKFVLDRQNFINNRIKEEFIQKELLPSIKVSSSEIENLYKEKKIFFVEGITASVSIFTFNTPGDAMLGRNSLMNEQQKNQDFQDKIQDIKELKDYKANVDIHFEDKRFPDKVLQQIFSMETYEVSWPIKINDQYTIIIKESEQGQRIKSIEEVSSILEEELIMKKLSVSKNKLLSLKRGKYKVIDRIDYCKYF